MALIGGKVLVSPLRRQSRILGEQLFQVGRWPGRLPHYAREETGFAEMLVEPHTGLLIGLYHHNANHGEKFEESHTGIRRRPNGPYSTVVFRAPDNNQFEFAAPAPPDGDS